MSLLISWSEPELCTYDLDISRPWFVYFTIKNELTGLELRKQFRGGINYYPKVKERLAEGNALKSYWKKKLEGGRYNPFLKGADINPIEMPATVQDALAKILALRKASLKKKSFRNYRNIHDMFLSWLIRFGYHKLRLYQFSQQLAQAYCDYLLIEKSYSGKTHNNQQGILHAFFSSMMVPGRKWIEVNPFAGIQALPEDLGKNIPYDEQEKNILIKFFKERDQRMYYAVCFVFHCFIRKTELTTIRVGDISWENRTIKVNSDAAKNRIQDSVTIPDGLLEVMLEMGLDRAPKHFYIFGTRMETCADRMKRPDDISDRYLVLKKEKGYSAGDGKDFYSWKPTGVIAYWGLVKDPYAIMRQCRHGDLKTTLIYLKSLGLNPNAAFLASSAIL